jgi:hypothetical protein
MQKFILHFSGPSIQAIALKIVFKMVMSSAKVALTKATANAAIKLILSVSRTSTKACVQIILPNL